MFGTLCLLESYLYSEVGTSWHQWAIDIARISVGTLVEVALEGVEDIFHATEEFNECVIIDKRCVAHSQACIEETLCANSHILCNITPYVV